MSPSPPLFSDEWAAVWAARLNASATYRTAAAAWEGAVVLEIAGEAGRPARAVFLDLWHGACRAARAATPADHAAAEYLFRGGESSWREVLGGRLAPVTALLTGRLTLVRGNLAALLPFATAVRELLASAATFETAFADP